MDSVGWDQIKDADTPNIHKLCKSLPLTKAYSFGTWTPASMASILRGSTPEPISNKYSPYDYLKGHERNLKSKVFKENGYYTYFITSNPIMTDVVGEDFHFQYTHYDLDGNIQARRMIDYFLNNYKEPFFCVFLFTETHHPYLGKDLKRETQKEAITYLDAELKYLYDNVPENTRIIVTSDHGDIFVEEKFLGHDPRCHEIIERGLLGKLLEVFICVIEK